MVSKSKRYEQIAMYLKTPEALGIIDERRYTPDQAVWLAIEEEFGNGTESSRVSAYNAVAIRLGLPTTSRWED